MKIFFSDIFSYRSPLKYIIWGVFFCVLSIIFSQSVSYASDVNEMLCGGLSKEECERKYMTDSEFRKQMKEKAKDIKQNYKVANGVACPSMKILKERYQGDCFPCQIVNVLLASFMKAAGKVYDVSREAGVKLLLLGSLIWLAFWVLKKISSLANVEPSSMTNELIVFFGKVLVAYCFINAGIGTLVSYAINPILAAGADFGSALLLETEGIEVSGKPQDENQYSGPTDIVSKSVMDKILKLTEGVSNEVATNLIIGSGLTCFSIQNGLHIEVPLVIDINIPDIWLWLCGAAIWCVGFMLVLAVCYYLIDIPFKIGFAVIALPVVIGLWPFKITAGKLKAVVDIALNAAFTFLFLALSSSYAIRLMSAAFSAEGDLTYENQTYTGKEALFKAFEIDNVEYVQSLFDFTGPAFLIILFCYIYGFKMISSITTDFPSKFESGMTNAAGSPMHHMATAATSWAAGKVAAPFKAGLDIAAHQAGKAATTVTKAAANVGIGVVGTAVGAGGKFVGRGINKMTAGLVERQKGLKAAADSIDRQNSIHNVGMGEKLQGKIGKASASIGLGLANAINKLGKNMESGGDKLMNPGRNTLDRVVTATKNGSKDIITAGSELKGALKETVAAITPQKIAEKMQQSSSLNKVGNTILQTKSAMKQQAHQDFANAKKNLKTSKTTLNKSIGKNRKTLISAYSKIKNVGAQIKSGELVDKIANSSKSGIKYVASGKFISAIQNSASNSIAQMNARTRQDIIRSKNNVRSFSEIGQNMQQNFGMVGADFSEAKQNLLHGHMKQNWQNLQETVSEYKDKIAQDTGINNMAGIGIASATGIGLGMAAARHFVDNAQQGIDYVKDDHGATGLMGAIGTGVVRPSVALGMTIGRTANQTIDSAYTLAEGTVLTGIGIAQTILSPVGNVTRSAMHVGYAIGDTGLALATGAGDTVGVVGSKINVAYQYTKYATRPIAAVAGMPFRGAGKVLGFAATAVDETLYGGYRAVAFVGKGIAQGADTLGQGANVLYHGVKDRTVVGQIASKTLKSGSKTLKLAVKGLKLGRDVVLAAAGEDIRKHKKETPEERRELNKQYWERKRREKQDKKRQKRRQAFWDEMDRQEQERRDEEEKRWKEYEEKLKS